MAVVTTTTSATLDAADRILDAWQETTQEERYRGIVWYPNAHEIAVGIARRSGYSVSDIAGVIAALSPGLDWEMNVRSAQNAVLGRVPVLGYGPNRAKAKRILDGEHPECVLGGLKVCAFYRLIRDGGNDIDVCVDGHAANMALGRGKLPLRESDTSPEQQKLVARAFRLASVEIGEQACAVQAATWLAWRASGGFAQGRIEFFTPPIGRSFDFGYPRIFGIAPPEFFE